MSAWQGVQAQATAEQMGAVVEAAARDLSGLPLAVLRNRRELGQRADAAVRAALRPYPVQVSASQMQAVIAQVVARVGGLGFLDALIPPNSDQFTDLLVNGDGTVWGRRKGAMRFDDLDLHPAKDEVWRAVEALLAPEGRACSESTPTVDVKIPRNRELGFGGARVKALHPVIAPGDGYPSLAIRLFEPEPVEPAQIVRWGVFPEAVMGALLEAVGNRLRVLVIGGTATGKTSLLVGALPRHPASRAHREDRGPGGDLGAASQRDHAGGPARAPGSNVPAYEVKNGVDDAMRLAPNYVIVGEVRDGHAALSLFRALMSDHAGLTTYHAEGPDEAVFRMGVHMYADAGVRMDAAKALFAQALDLVVQIGWRNDRRLALGVWELAGLSGGDVKFRPLWQPGDERLGQVTRRRG